MIAKITCALVIVFAFGRGEDVDSFDLKGDKSEAAAKVKNMTSTSIKNVHSANENFNQNIKYFNNSLIKYQNEEKALTEYAMLQLNHTTNLFVGNAIDQGKQINTFKCLSNLRQETKLKITKREQQAFYCNTEVYSSHKNQTISLQNELNIIQSATVGLYDVILQEIQASNTSSAISALVHKAEVRENKLNNLLRQYMELGSTLRIKHNEGQIACVRNAEKSNNDALKVCSDKMKAC